MSQTKTNTLFALFERALGMLFSLGTAMLLLRSLSKEDFAAWGLFLLITYFLDMARSGLIQNGLVRNLTLTRESPQSYVSLKQAAFLLNVFFTFCSNLILWLIMDWIADSWNVPQLLGIIPVYFVLSFVQVILTHFNYIQQALHEFKGIFLANISSKAAIFCWVVYCYVSGASVNLFSLAMAMLLGLCIGSMASWYFLQKLVQPKYMGENSFNQIFHWIKQLISYGKWVLGTNFSTMLYKNVDKLSLGYLIGPAAFAVYEAAGKVTQLVEAPSFSIASVVFPKGSERLKEKGPNGIKLLYERSVGAILAIVLPFILGILLFPETIMLLFAGDAYLESADILVITAFFGLLLPFAVQFGTILDATGKPHINFAYTFFTAVLNLVLSWYFIQWYGLRGAAWATLIGYGVSFVLTQLYLHRHFRINALQAIGYIPEFYVASWKMLVGRKD